MYVYHSPPHSDGDQTIITAAALVSGSEENAQFSKYTPAGSLQIVIKDDAPALSFYKEGKEFYLEMIDCSNTGLSFGRVLEAIKQGKRAARKGWNGKGMFIFMRPADELNVEFVVDKVKSLPQSVKDYYLQDIVDESGQRVPVDENDMVTFTAYICMKAADGTIVNGWLASQTDMLAEDWVILE